MGVAADEHVVLIPAVRRFGCPAVRRWLLPKQRLSFDFGRHGFEVWVVDFVVFLVDVDAGLAFDSRQVSLAPEQGAIGHEHGDLVGAERLRVVDDNVLQRAHKGIINCELKWSKHVLRDVEVLVQIYPVLIGGRIIKLTPINYLLRMKLSQMRELI